MIEVLRFIFQDFWHFIGTLLLLSVLLPFKIVIHKDKKDDNS